MTAAYDAASINSISQAGSGSTGSLTTAHTPVGTPNLALAFVEVGAKAPTGNVTSSDLTSVTYGGSAMTLVGTSVQASSPTARLWLYKLTSPPSGPQNCVVTRAAGTNNSTIILAVMTFTGTSLDVQNYTSTTSDGATNSPNLVVTSATGHIVVGCGCQGSLVTGVGAGMTSRVAVNADAETAGDNMAVATAAGASTVTTSYTSSANDSWLLLGADVYETGGGGTNAPAGLASGTGTAQTPSVLKGTIANPGAASGTGTSQAPATAVKPNAGLASGTGTAQTPSIVAGKIANPGAASGTGTAAAPAVAVKANAGNAAGTGAARNPSAARFGTAVSANSRYVVDQVGDPYFISGNSPQNMVPNATLSEMEDFFSDQQGRGFNSAQVHLIFEFDADAETGTGPFSSDSTLAVGAGQENYWATIDSMFDLAETYGFTLWATVIDNISCGLAIESVTNANCFAYGQFLGARYKDRPNLIWTFGNDFVSTQYTARNPKYLNILAGIRDQGDTHISTLWADATSSDDNTAWDTSYELNLGYNYDEAPYNQSLPAYNLTRTGFPKPFFWGEGTYFGEHNSQVGSSTDLELRKLPWWTITAGGCGHFFGTHEVWRFGNWQTEATSAASIYSQLALIPTVFAGLDGWEKLVPDQSHVFQTGGRGTDGSLDSSTLATAAVTPDGLLGVVYFPTSRSSITFDTSKISGTVTAYWLDPTDGSTTTESNPAAPTHPGTNSGGDPDFVLVFQGTTAASPSAGLASGTGAANAPKVSVAPQIAAASGTGTSAAPASSVKPNASAAAGTGTAPNATVQTGVFTNAPAGAASGTGTAQTPAASVKTPSGVASATGTSQTPTVLAGKLVNPGAATGTGTANTAAISAQIPAAVAAGVGIAYTAQPTNGGVTIPTTPLSRTLTVPYDDRTYDVPGDNRTLEAT